MEMTQRLEANSKAYKGRQRSCPAGFQIRDPGTGTHRGESQLIANSNSGSWPESFRHRVASCKDRLLAIPERFETRETRNKEPRIDRNVDRDPHFSPD
jgi:hypothetical protein